MKYLVPLVFVIIVPAATPAGAQDFPGLVSARLLPGWTAGDGTRFSALEIVLEPGWKTYWRSPGESGIPPSFDWQEGLGAVEFFWPAPEVFEAGGARSLGYRDRLVLPFTVAPTAAGPAGTLRAEVEFGLCREVCVPVTVTLAAPAPAAGDAPDPRILAALDAQPVAGATGAIRCEAEPIADGMRITARLPAGADGGGDGAGNGGGSGGMNGGMNGGGAVVAELSDPSIWVSDPEISHRDGGLTAAFEAVAPGGKPFPLTGDAIRITLLGDAGAVEFDGCPLPGS